MAGKISRRSLLDWMGKATVLSLGGNVLAACSRSADYLLASDSESGSGRRDADTGNDTGTESDSQSSSADTDTETRTVCPSDSSDFPFEPGGTTSSVFSNWGERTVDRQDLAQILEEWRLTVDGMVANSIVFRFGDLLDFPIRDILVDFHCVEGWSVYDVPWNGVHLSDIFAEVNPLGGASHLTVYSVGDKYTESIPLEVALEENTLLAFGVDCNTIPLKHGFPLRLVVPRKYGYKSAKFVYRLELTDRPVAGYWEQFGYTYEADVPASRLRPGKY